MALNFTEAFTRLEEWGFYETILPFLLVFVLVFAILERINIFGPQSKKFNAVIALVMGILLVRQGTLVEFINTYLPNVSAVVVVFLGFLIILGFFGFGSTNMRGGIMIAFVIVSLIGGIWALTQATAQEDVEFSIPWFGEFEITEADAGALVVIGVFLLIVGIAMYKPKKRGYEGFLDAMNKMGDSFAGGNPPR